MVCMIEALASDWRRLDERIDEVSAEIETLARKAIFGAWLGMAPKQEAAPSSARSRSGETNICALAACVFFVAAG